MYKKKEATSHAAYTAGAYPGIKRLGIFFPPPPPPPQWDLVVVQRTNHKAITAMNVYIPASLHTNLQMAPD